MMFIAAAWLGLGRQKLMVDPPSIAAAIYGVTCG